MRKKLVVRSETVAVLSGKRLEMIRGGVIPDGDSTACSVACKGPSGTVCSGLSYDLFCETVDCSGGPVCTNSGGPSCGPTC